MTDLTAVPLARTRALIQNMTVQSPGSGAHLWWLPLPSAAPAHVRCTVQHKVHEGSPWSGPLIAQALRSAAVPYAITAPDTHTDHLRTTLRMRCDPTQLPGLLNSLLQATEQADPTHCTAAALKDLQRQRRSLRAHIRTELLRFLFPSHSLPPGFPPIQSLPGPEETRHALTTATNPSFTVIGGDHCPPLRTDAIRRSEPRTEFHRALPFHREAPRPTSPVLVPLPGHPGASVRLAAFPPDPDAARPGTPAWASFTLANTLLTDPRGSFLTDAVRHHSYVLDGVLDEDHTMTMLVAEPDPQDLSPFLNALHTALRAFAAVTPSNAAVQAAAHRHLTQEALHLTALESLADRLAALQGRGSPPETLLAHWEAVRHITVEDISHVTQHLGPDSFSGIVLADPALLPPNEPLRMNP